MEIKVFNKLPKEAVQIRTEVFMDEQGFKHEFDDTDNTAVHLLLYVDKEAAATCRYFPEADGGYVIGRVAVIKKFRHRQLGSKLLLFAEDEIKKYGGQSIKLHAQVRAQQFYRQLGYEPYGEADGESFCPHIWMRKQLG